MSLLHARPCVRLLPVFLLIILYLHIYFMNRLTVKSTWKDDESRTRFSRMTTDGLDVFYNISSVIIVSLFGYSTYLIWTAKTSRMKKFRYYLLAIQVCQSLWYRIYRKKTLPNSFVTVPSTFICITAFLLRKISATGQKIKKLSILHLLCFSLLSNADC